MKEKIIEVMNKANPNIGDDFELDLMKEELIDSLEIVNIVMDLEDAFNIEIDPELVIPENFNTMNNILQLIESIVG